MLHVFLSVSIIFLIIYGIEGFGVKPGRIEARINDTIRIRCSVAIAGGELNFYDGDELIPSSQIIRINDTHIKLKRVYSKPTKKNFTCKEDRDNVGFTEVYVDDRMAPVENFRCRTIDLRNLKCSFNKPEQAVLYINYSFNFAVNGGKPSNLSKFDQDGKGGYSTVIPVPSTEKSLSEKSFAIALFEKNLLYNREENFKFELMECLTPNPIEEVKVADEFTTANSANISFKLPKELEKVSNDILYDVRIKLAHNESAEWKILENPRLNLKGEVGNFLLHLDFANTDYVVKIRMKSRIADNNEDFWSQYKNVTFKTRAKLPETLPETCTNCFNVMDNKNIVLYWKEVPKLYQNADNFSYRVLVQNEREKEILHQRLSKTSMVLPNNLTAVSLEVRIFAENSKGVSEGFSRLLIPLQQLQSLSKALKIRKELVDGRYDVSWKLLRNIDVESYTIFWCHQKVELANQCDDSIQFENISPHTLRYEIKDENLLQFGVAINRNNSIATGFEWGECPAAKRNREIGQVLLMWANVKKTSISLNWKLHCFDESNVDEYIITYCLLNDERLDECEGSPASSTVRNTGTEKYDIEGLKTYRFYNVSIALKSQNRVGVQKTIKTRTLEGAPTAPRDLQAKKIDNSSVEITWSRPSEVNGDELTYQVWYNNRKININEVNTLKKNFTFSIELLEAFTNYTITVVACTSKCSESSNSLKLRTAIGLPGMPLQPKLEESFKESKDTKKISWENPKTVAGNLNFFDLKLSRLNERGFYEEKIYRLNGQTRSCFVEGFNCDNINFQVRAVNVDKNVSLTSNQSEMCSEHEILADVERANELTGEWSQPLIFSCTKGQSLAAIGFIFLFATSSILLAFMFIKFYKKYLRMKDIHTEWPSALDPFTPKSLNNPFEQIRNLDLIKDAMPDIESEEEEEEVEQEKFLPEKQVEKRFEVAPPIVKQIGAQQRKSSRTRNVTNPAPNVAFHPLTKNMSSRNKVRSAPVTPEKHVALSELADSYFDASTGYMKMNPPSRLRTESSTSVDGYLDMTGKSLPPIKFPSSPKIVEAPLKVIIEPIRETGKSDRTDYVANVNNFIKESEFNDGYVLKRASIIQDPNKRRPPFIANSNGYVGILKK